MTLGTPGRAALRAVQALAAGAIALYVAQSTLSICGESADGFFETYVYNGVIFIAAGLCISRAVLMRRERVAWLVLGAGLLSWALGEAYYSIFLADLSVPPLPSWADALWLAFYPACYVAIVLLVRERVREFRASLWLDGLVGALAASAIGADLLFGALTGAGRDSATVAVDLSYAMGDLLLLGFVVAVFGMTGWRPGRALSIVGAGLVISAVVDGYFLYESAIGDVPLTTAAASLWLVSALMLGFAAWTKPAEEQSIHFEGWRVLVMPAVFGASGLVLLAYHTFEPANALALTLAIATLAVVIFRMAVTFRENISLLASSRAEALTDSLTGLDNRRKLMYDLEDALAVASTDRQYGLMLLDLDGFKQYNDRFGHPMGDALLARLGRQLSTQLKSAGNVYRLGGDEFCVLATGSEDRLKIIAEAARDALSGSGEGFDITCSCGVAVLPGDAKDITLALHLADERLYSQKGNRRRSTTSTQTGAALLQALEERVPELRDHLGEVADLSVLVGQALGLAGDELDDLRRAAELHDVGKVAIPDSILQKREALDASEWDFIRRHTIVGERILNAAPALNDVARIVRASHERWDGAGYPDGLKSDEIPLGARIVTVCDAYHSMTSTRPYGHAHSRGEALAELRRCAGAQFDPAVVAALCRVFEEPAPAKDPAPLDAVPVL